MKPTLRIRPYAPADDAACKRLELVASQFQSCRGLVKAAIEHYAAFDAKAQQFAQHLVLVCTDDELGGAVFGVIAVAVKRANCCGALRKVGYVFDLRVDQSHQRRGIALALSAEAEARVSQAPFEVEYLYLSVNSDNTKAKALYSRMGWSLCSKRCLFFDLLSRPAALTSEARAAAGGVLRIRDTSEAVGKTADAYAGNDLCLEREELERSLFLSPLYLGTFALADGRGSYAQLSLWHSSFFTGFLPIRLLFPWELWRVSAPLLFVSAAATAACAFLKLLSAASANQTSSPYKSAALYASALITALLAAKAGRFVRWARSRSHFRARLFGAVHEGPEWEPLMRAVRVRISDEARDLGFTLLVMNTDVDAPLNIAFGKPTSARQRRAATAAAAAASATAAASEGEGAQHLLPAPSAKAQKKEEKAMTEFWHKSLSPALPSPLPLLEAQAFFDPRDF